MTGQATPPTHKRTYGYAGVNPLNLDSTSSLLDKTAALPWFRPFEVQAFSNAVSKPAVGHLSAQDSAFFIDGAVHGFRWIAAQHGLTPTQMWSKVEEGLKIVGMHEDDLEDVQELVFGWKDLTSEMLERYRWRYPDRCPLLDVLCTLDDSCEKLNAVQDWMLELKGAKDRRRLDILPELPKTDAVRTPLVLVD